MRTAFGSRLPDQQPWLQRGGEGKIVWQALHTESPYHTLLVGRHLCQGTSALLHLACLYFSPLPCLNAGGKRLLSESLPEPVRGSDIFGSCVSINREGSSPEWLSTLSLSKTVLWDKPLRTQLGSLLSYLPGFIPRGSRKRQKPHTGTLPETEIPKPGTPKSGIPKTGIPKAGIPKLGIPKTDRFTAPLIQTPLRLPLN